MNIGAVLADFGGAIAGMFVDIVQALTSIFFSVGEGGAISIEPLGYISMFGLVITVVFFVFRWISGLFKVKGTK